MGTKASSGGQFGRAVAEVFRGIRETVDKHPTTKDTPAPNSSGPSPLDPSVKEQVVSDIDKLIEKHDPGTGKQTAGAST